MKIITGWVEKPLPQLYYLLSALASLNHTVHLWRPTEFIVIINNLASEENASSAGQSSFCTLRRGIFHPQWCLIHFWLFYQGKQDKSIEQKPQYWWAVRAKPLFHPAVTLGKSIKQNSLRYQTWITTLFCESKRNVKSSRGELGQLHQTFSVEKSLLDITDLLKTILAGLLPFNLSQPDGPQRRAKPPPDGPLRQSRFHPPGLPYFYCLCL